MQRPTTEDVRAEFVAIAARRFAAQGFAATSLEEIAADAGYSKAAVLYHFGSKDDLLVAVMSQHLDATNALVDELEARPPGPERTEHAIDALVGFALESRPSAPLTLSPAHDVATALARHADLLVSLSRLRERMTCLLVGPQPTLDQRVRALVAFSGIPAAVIELRGVPAERLHTCLAAVLRDAVHPTPSTETKET